MKSSTLFAVLAAAAVSLTANAKYSKTQDYTGFEGLAANNVVTTGVGDKSGDSTTGGNASHFYLETAEGAENATMALAYASDADKPSLPENVKLPNEFANVGSGDQYLKLNTEGSTLWRTINAKGMADSAEKTAPYALDDAGIYLDTVMKFTISEDDPDLDGTDAKIALWLKAGDTPGIGTLYVKAARVAEDGDVGGWKNPVTTPFKTKQTLNTTDWYRVTIRAIKDFSDSSSDMLGFVVYVNGTPVSADLGEDEDPLIDAGTQETVAQAYTEFYQANQLFPAITGNQSSTIFGLGFQGTGMVDDYVATKDVNDTTECPSFTFTDVEGATAQYRYSTEDAWTTYTNDEKIDVEAGTTVYWQYVADAGYKLANNSGYQELTEGATTFGDGVTSRHVGTGTSEDPYLLAEVADFAEFVKTGTASAGVYYKLANDVALTGEWTGIGAFDAKDALADDLATFKANAFQGVFDGNGKTISGLVLQRGDYVGFFGSAYGATIKNLKISLGNATGFGAAENGTDGSKDSKGNPGADYGGGVICGVAAGGTTIENCETLVAGDYANFVATKGLAGILGYAAKGVTLKGCVNNLNVTTGNEKAAGLVACAQPAKDDYATAGITIEDCTNTGDVECTANDKYCTAGLVSFIQLPITFKGKIEFSGSLTQAVAQEGDTPKVYSLVATYNAGCAITIDAESTIKVPAQYKTVSDDYAGNVYVVDGVRFATVDANDVATLVFDASLAKDASVTYKVMSSHAALQLALNESVKLDQALATASVTAADDDANMIQEDTEEESTVTTFTCIAKPTTPIVKIGEKTYTDLSAAVADAKDGDTLTLIADVDLDAGLDCATKLTFAIGDYKFTVGGEAEFGINENVTITRGTGGILMLGTVSVAAGKTLDMSTFGFGSGIIASEGDVNAGNIALAATATIKFAAGTDPNAMLARNATFFKDTATGATFYAGTTKYVYDGDAETKWVESAPAIASVTLDAATVAYGTEYAPAVTVKDADGNTVAAENYDVVYSPDYTATTPAGTEITVTVTAKGTAYSGSATAKFTVVAKEITLDVSLDAEEVIWMAEAARPTVMVEDFDADAYTIAWTANGEEFTWPTANPEADVEVTCTVTLNEGGNYVGSGTATFTLKPAAPSVPEEQAEIKVETDGEGNTTVDVKPLDGVTEVVIGGVNPYDETTKVIIPTSVEKVSGVSPEQVVITYTPEGGETTYDITTAFIKNGDATEGVMYDLDPDGSVEIVGETEPIPVKPTMTEATGEDAGTIADGEVATKTIPGLTYTLMRMGELGGKKTNVASEKATGTSLTLKDTTGTKPTDKAFYVIEVTKKVTE